MNRYIWCSTLSKLSAPSWPCPECTRGTLNLVPKSLTFKETISSQRAHGAEGWDPELISYTFTAWLKCSHIVCGQEVVVSGVGGVEAWYDNEEGTTGWSDYFAPRWCSPMPDLFQFPAKCPVDVKKQLRASFRLFWSDHAAAASKVRIALECLLNHLGVPKRKKDKNGKFADLSLHKRVEILQQGESDIGSQLMALKWLGNTGSHEAQVSRDDLLDAFEILEHALSELIDRRSEKVIELAKMLTKKHAPRRKK